MQQVLLHHQDHALSGEGMGLVIEGMRVQLPLPKSLIPNQSVN